MADEDQGVTMNVINNPILRTILIAIASATLAGAGSYGAAVASATPTVVPAPVATISAPEVREISRAEATKVVQDYDAKNQLQMLGITQTLNSINTKMDRITDSVSSIQTDIAVIKAGKRR